jgi:hypothetical protein
MATTTRAMRFSFDDETGAAAFEQRLSELGVDSTRCGEDVRADFRQFVENEYLSWALGKRLGEMEPATPPAVMIDVPDQAALTDIAVEQAVRYAAHLCGNIP